MQKVKIKIHNEILNIIINLGSCFKKYFRLEPVLQSIYSKLKFWYFPNFLLINNLCSFLNFKDPLVRLIVSIKYFKKIFF